MTSVQGRSCSRQKRPFVAPSIAPFDFSPPPKSEFLKQPVGPLGLKSSAIATDVPKYSEDDLQRILKVVLEA